MLVNRLLCCADVGGESLSRFVKVFITHPAKLITASFNGIIKLFISIKETERHDACKSYNVTIKLFISIKETGHMTLRRRNFVINVFDR